MSEQYSIVLYCTDSSSKDILAEGREGKELGVFVTQGFFPYRTETFKDDALNKLEFIWSSNYQFY